MMDRFHRNRPGGAQRHDGAEPGHPSRLRRDDHNRSVLDHLRRLETGVEVAHPQRAWVRLAKQRHPPRRAPHPVSLAPISALPRSAKDRSASRTAAVFVPELRFAGAHGGAIRPADDSVVGLHHGVGEEHLPLDGSQLTAVLPIWKDQSRRDRKRSMTACDAQIPQAWLDAVSAITPAWVSAVSAATVALLGLAVVARWWLLRRVLRGSAAAIIALLLRTLRETSLPSAGLLVILEV